MRRPSIGDSGAPGPEAAEIRKLVKKAAEPEGFPLFELTFGEDSTGNPAVWISFLVESAANPTNTLIRSLRRLRKRVETVLFESGISRIPYIRFRELSERAS